MQNRLFNDRELKILLSPERWAVVTSFLPPAVSPCGDSRHRAWRRAHTHAHQHGEILFALRGSSTYGFLDRAYRCRPGTLIYFDAFEAHDLGYASDTRDVRHLWVSFVQDRILWCIRDIERGRMETVTGSNGMIIGEDIGLQAGRVIADCRTAAEARPDVARLRLLGLLASVLGRIADEGYREPVRADRDALQAQTIDAIRHHILATGGSDASLDTLTRISGYSKFHFVRMFKRYTGQPVGRYVNWCRIQKMDELRQAGKSLKEIGAALGFSCQSAFCRWRRQQQAN